MKKFTQLTLFAALISTQAITVTAQEKQVEEAPAVDASKHQANMSYGLGFQNGEQFASFGFAAEDLDKDAYTKGLMAALMKKDFEQDPKEYDAAMKAYDKIVQEREKALANANEAAEKTFLEENGKREGVITTPSGLQYEILTKGTGKTYQAPKVTSNGMDTFTEFHLKTEGSLLDGTVFMETPENESIPFSLNVIPGLAEALKIMPVGSKWKIYVPAKLGFGDQRQGPKISPKSLLTYELELTDIKKKAMNMPQGHPMPIVPR